MHNAIIGHSIGDAFGVKYELTPRKKMEKHPFKCWNWI